MMTLDPTLTLAVLLGGALIGGMITGAAGFGSGPVVMGIWLQVLDPAVAAPLLMLNALIYVPASLSTVWHAINVRRILPLAAGALVGAPAGAWLLTAIPAEMLKLVIGVLLVAYCFWQIARPTGIVIVPTSWRPDAAVGVAGGIVGGAAAMPGVVWTMWTGLRGWTKDEQRAVYQPLNFATVAFSLASLAAAGLVTRQVGVYTLWVLPVTLAGVALGVPLYKRISERGFRRMVQVILGLIGLALIGGVLLGGMRLGGVPAG